MKFCKKCKQIKSLESFYKDLSKKDKLTTICKTCNLTSIQKYSSKPENREKAKTRTKIWYSENKEYAKNKRKANYDPVKRLEHLLTKTYNITLNEYNELLLKQNHKCAICGSTKGTKNGGRLVVDHCHETGNIRGLLCYSCNRALGMFQDKTEIVKKAFLYLEKFSCQN